MRQKRQFCSKFASCNFADWSEVPNCRPTLSCICISSKSAIVKYFCLRMKHYCTDRFSIPAWNNMANNSGKPERIRIKFYRMYAKVRPYVFKCWRPGPNGRKMATRRVGAFATGTMNSHFFVRGQISIKLKIRGQNVNRCPVLNLNRRILKIYP